MANITTSRIIWFIFASLTLFIMGIATGVMLMQVNPRDPNLTWIEAMQKKTVVAPSQDTQQACPPTLPKK